MSLPHATGQPGCASLAERQNDLYESPQQAVTALLRAEKIPSRVWEPACGPGSIVRTLRAAGHHVTATDLVNYGCEGSTDGVDFLIETRAPEGVEAIVTNPPYKLGCEFVAHALDIVPHVYMLLRLAFLESSRRARILDCGRLRAVHVFRRRLPMMHRAGWTGPRVSSAIPFAWFCWRSDYCGPATIDRIDWGRP